MLAVILAVAGCLAPFTANATDKSGVSPTVLSLPSGPGSIEGLGESFEPQLNSGTAAYAIAFKAPPGRAGFGPSVGLRYNSGHGSGIAGLGWRLNLPYLQRQTDQGLPFYTDAPQLDGIDNDRDGTLDEPDEWDSIVYSNGEALVPLADGSFRFEHESSFTRFQRDTDPGRDGKGWIATERDGTRLWFGITDQGRVQDGQGRVFRWLLEASEDTNGNRISFTHEAKDAGAQRYCAAIDYNRDMQVAFDYQPRPDIVSDYRPTFQLKTAYRLSAVQMRVAGETIRGYRLGYAQTSDTQPLSLLTTITEIGRDGLTSLPPAAFGYVPFDAAAATPLAMPSAPTLSLNDPSIDLFDINADGLPDILNTGDIGTIHDYYLNLGPDDTGVVRWSERQSTVTPTKLDLASNDIQAADLDGDGRGDLLRRNASDVQVYRTANRATNPGWEAGPLIAQALFNFANADTRLVDLNHDRRIDVLRTTGSGDVYAWLNLSDGGNHRWSQAFEPALPNPVLRLDNPDVRLADMNGDRLPDLVRAVNDSLSYYPSRGFGQFGAAVPVDNPPWGLIDRARLLLVDVNGDGRADALYVTGSQVRVWLNLGLDPDDQGRARFADAFSVPAPYTNSYTVFRQADLNGNGSTDILWSTNPGGGQETFAYLDFAPGEQPYQLKTISNGIGLTTTVHYRSSVQDWLRDRDAGAPWPDTVPIQVPVIAQVDTDDGLASYSTSYRYHNGHYDGLDQEFRGFAAAEQREHGDASAPDLITAYRFDTGTEHDALKGMPLALETRNADGGVFYREDYRWQTRELAAAVAGEGTVSFPYQTEKRRTLIEQGNGTPVVLRWDYEYDDYGNLTRQVEHGRLDTGLPEAPPDPALRMSPIQPWDDERITETSYSAAYPDGREHWILGLPVIQTIADDDGERVAETRGYYDGGTTLGNLSKGNPTRTEQWVADEHFAVTDRRDYDQYGNVIAIYDALYGQQPGHLHRIDYDPDYHSFPVAEHIDTGGLVLSVQADYDPAFGVVTASTDFNGHRTSYGYDPFGRLTRIVKPLDSEASPTLAYDYVLAHPIGDGRLINWIETRSREQHGGGTLDSRTFFDGLGRAVMTRAEGEKAGQVVVSDTVQFNARKQPWRRYLPYFDQPSTLDYQAPGFHSAYVEVRYDALGRNIRQTQPDGSYAETRYAPLAHTLLDEEQTNPSSPHFGAAMRYETDGLLDEDGSGRLRRVTELTPEPWLTQYSYDVLGNITGYIDSQNNRKQIQYDGLGRQVFMNDPDRGHYHRGYDDAGNQTQTQDAKGQIIRYAYDGANRILAEYYSAEDAPNADTPDVAYHYDQPAGSLQRGEFWPADAAIAIADALLTDTTGADPPAGEGAPAPRLQRGSTGGRSASEASTSAQDHNNDGTLDVADLIQAKRSAETTNTVTATNTLGQLAWVQDQSGEEHRSYDQRGRSQWVLKRIIDERLADATPASLRDFHTAYEYDAADRVTRRHYPDGTYVDYQYNPRGLLEAIPNVVTRFDYNPVGQLTARRYSNGVETTYSYDSRQRLARIHSVRERDGIALQDLNNQFDAVSNITAITDGRTPEALTTLGAELGITPEEAAQFSETQRFGYDNLYRLTYAGNPELWGEIKYSYDRIGNMIGKHADMRDASARITLGNVIYGGSFGSWDRHGREAADPAGPHAQTETSGLTDSGFSFDANGNLEHRESQDLEWDRKDRLVRFQEIGKSDASYLYDYQDQRRVKVVRGRTNSDGTTLYFDDHGEVRNGRMWSYVHGAGDRLALANPAQSRYRPAAVAQSFLANHIGSVAQATLPNGALIVHNSDFPFGGVRFAAVSPQQRTAVPYRFADKESDLESSFNYFGARYHAPALGRFASVDPVALSGSTPLLPVPQTLNAYAYSINNPNKYEDPDGKFLNIIGGAIIGGVIGASIEGARQYLAGEELNTDKLLAAAAGGAVSGAIAGATGGTSLIANAGARLAVQGAASVVGDVAGGATTRAMLGEENTLGTAAQDAVTGLITFGGVRMVGRGIRGPRQAPPSAKPLSTTAASNTKGPDFVVTPGGTIFPVPRGAKGPTPVLNSSGAQTGVAFTGGSGGANGQVSTLRIMNATQAKGNAPAYPNGYMKYENSSSPRPQGVDPYSGKTLPNSQSHFPID